MTTVRGFFRRLRAETLAIAGSAREQGLRVTLVDRARFHLEVDQLGSRITELDQRTQSQPEISSLERRVSELESSVEAARIRGRIDDFTAWLRVAPPSDVLISVVTPSKNRPALLARAVRSVLEQTHQRWELLLIDDGGNAGGADLAAELNDPRIRVLETEGVGPAAACNRALEVAEGDHVAYLDDDNLMHPTWLAAVAEGFSQHPEAGVVYGGRLMPLGGELPQLLLDPFDQRRLRALNLIDQNVLAHRRGVADLRIAEDLPSAHDWDYALRLAEEASVLRLPAIACNYSVEAGDRMSVSATIEADWAEVRLRARERQPLRVLGYNHLFPLLSETYVADELAALVRYGNADLAWCRRNAPLPAMEVSEPVYGDLDEAIETFDPDLLFIHWAVFARSEFETLDRIGRPFAVRGHGFDLDLEMFAEILAHPLCIGAWTYPGVRFKPDGAHDLPLLFTSADQLPPPAQERDLILMVCASLPKKDWPLVLDALGRLPDVERRLVMATTEGYESLPGEIILQASAMDSPPLIQVNLTRRECHALMARAAMLLYTLHPNNAFGQPMSIAEGLVSGCSVVLPDRPECREYAGPGARTYKTAQDIADHAREILAGGPEVEAERAANREHGLAHFAEEGPQKQFAAEVITALERWQIGQVFADRERLNGPGSAYAA